MGSSLCPRGSDTQAERSSKYTGSGIKTEDRSGRDKLNHLPWSSGKKKEHLHATKSELDCLYLNARSIIGKFDQLESWVASIEPDIIGITESWTNNSIRDSELQLAGYDLFRRDRPVDRAGGGVLLYVRSTLNAVEFSPCANLPEQVWCQIRDKQNCKFLVGVCYRTPSDDIFENDGGHVLVRDLLNELGRLRCHFLLMGDLNYRFLQWPPVFSTSDLGHDDELFCECLDDNFLTQHVLVPTRVDAILDLVITDEPDMVCDIADIGKLGKSDHQALQWKTQIKSERIISSRKVFDYTKADVVSIAAELSGIDWVQRFCNQGTVDCWNDFKKLLLGLESKYVPEKTIRAKTKPLWMTHRALKAVKRRHRIFRKYKDAHHPACLRADSFANTEIKKSKRNFELKLAENIKNDKKSFFAYAKCRTKSRPRVGPLVDKNGLEVNDDTLLTEILNDQFSSVFSAEEPGVVPVPEPVFRACEDEMMTTIKVDSSVVQKKLSLLREDKSVGSDDLSPRLLKALDVVLATPLTMIFEKSLTEGIVPLDWRTANITPIYKKGSRKLAENYRPISLTSHLSKMLESIIRDEISSHLDKYYLIGMVLEEVAHVHPICCRSWMKSPKLSTIETARIPYSLISKRHSTKFLTEDSFRN